MAQPLTSLSLDEQVALLMQGTNYGDEALARTMAAELRERLKEGRPLRVYCGFDPRTSDLHLGHTIPMRKLRQFQDLGHEVIFLVGNYTSLLGDPSDKDRLRPMLTPEQVEANARTYAEQAFKILDRERTQIRYNAEWLSQLSFLDVIRIAQNYTVQQFLARDNFAKRLEAGEPIYLHETFYALMQAYDAVALQTDVQVGGSDQLFNIITAGRKLQEVMGQRPQIGILMDILPGTDGVVKMSKSLGNHIPILSEPEDMYGKVMSIPDSALLIYFKLTTRYTPAMVAEVEQRLARGVNPRDIKMELAREIVTIFHSEEAAMRAEAHFVSVFQKRGLPEEMPVFTVRDGMNVVDVIVALGFAASKGEAKRLVAGGGVYLDGRTVTDPFEVPVPQPEVVLQVGKRRFARLVQG
ncbi:MAG: tyrosine--tRNA ligase [Anaerolineae bacterium]|nr:tyrosine--tRNA ligase [Thermoflexales bacterium]MDW8396353.1 tyrosine--tRNA ligase [Anaerolineae bacterium]